MGAENGRCDECGGALKFFEPKSRPQSAEWYCAHCHKSYDLEPEEPEVELDVE